MNRRDFGRRLLAMFAAGAVLDPEYLLWKPKPMVTVPAMPLIAVDGETGIAFRFIREWDHATSRQLYRWDALLGFPDLTPSPTILRG